MQARAGLHDGHERLALGSSVDLHAPKNKDDETEVMRGNRGVLSHLI